MSPAEFKTMRESMGISAAEVADLMGITQKSVYGFESSTRLIDVPENRAAELISMRAEFDQAVEHHGRAPGKNLPRFTTEHDFHAYYGVSLPLSAQGPMLWAASARRDKTIAYSR